jgi:hypothetical protein
MEIKNSLLDPAVTQRKRVEEQEGKGESASGRDQGSGVAAAGDQLSISTEALERASSSRQRISDPQQAEAAGRQIAEAIGRDPAQALGAFAAASNDSLNLLAG